MLSRSVQISMAPETVVRARSCKAFTLVEVILAIGIATGILLVALVFYRQAADLRGQILQESERISVMRLVIDRLAADLRAAEPAAALGSEFLGGSNSMRFVKEALNLPTAAAVPGGTTNENTDLATVSFMTMMETNGNKLSVAGLSRLEEPAKSRPALIQGPSPFSFDASGLSSSQTNRPAEPLTDFVRFVRFRYWDGAAWQLGWSNTVPPAGVEIVLATEPIADDAGPDAYPPDPLRRVVFLPGGLARAKSDLETLDSPLPR